MGRMLKAAVAGLAVLLYVWTAAVHHAPRVRAAKAARRALRRGPGS